MDARIKNVIILGGGTAGWMAASYLSKALRDTVSITLLEAPAIPKIGVGEATIPNLQPVFFDYLGIPEEEWMPACNATFKLAVKFINWRTPGTPQPHARPYNGRSDQFHHPFGLLPAADRVPLSHLWAHEAERDATRVPFDYACFVEPALMDANLSPRFLDGQRVTRYAWHLDAHLVADFLRRFATERQGVRHVRDTMVGVDQDARGFITGLRTQGGTTLEGDLFVDCSGFRGALINKVMREPFLDMSDHLLCDSAIACPLPYDPSTGIEPYTSAIAMDAGWVWKIPLLSRIGTGYVYASAFSDQERALKEFARLWGIDPGGTFNHIRFRVGRNRRAWVKNCVSIGLASCFLEPLESSGLYFTYAAIYQLAKHFPDRSFDRVLIDRFNREIADMFDDTRDFIQAHFYLAPREDTPFWRANHELHLADGIAEKIAMFKAGLPINPPAVDENAYYGNFENEFRNFWTNGSYHSIFAGLGVRPDHTYPALIHKPDCLDEAGELLAAVEARQKSLVARLPDHYEYLRHLNGT